MIVKILSEKPMVKVTTEQAKFIRSLKEKEKKWKELQTLRTSKLR